MLKKTVLRINELFIKEATNSPQLLEDMAAMEKYMAESYCERILIELLQNADDAHSTAIKFFEKNKNIYFANNGREFTEQDILNICRSGSSNKQRGSSIGYRGVGFKSTSYLSNEIVIFSNDTYFTFSKAHCAKQLNTNPSKVPTIRIPFFLPSNDIEQEIKDTIKVLKEQGSFTTVFIFKNAKYEQIIEELNLINNGYFLFLNNVSLAEIRLKSFNKEYKIIREYHGQYQYSINTITGDNISNWYIIHGEENSKVSIAFKINKEGNIIECHDNEALFHCYLPTLEKTGYSFKINGDFSTDPSRKHLTLDSDTKKAIEAASFLLFNLIKGIINQEHSSCKNEIIALLNMKTSYSKFSVILSDKLNEILKSRCWVKLNSGKLINPVDYKKAPQFLEQSEFNILREKSRYLRNLSILTDTSKNVPSVEKFFNNLSSKDYDLDDWIEVLKDKQFVGEVSELLLGKLYGYLVNKFKIKSIINSNSNYDLTKCYIRKGPLVKIFNQPDATPFSDDFKKGFVEIASTSDAEWFDRIYKTNMITIFNVPHNNFKPELINSGFSISSLLKNHLANQSEIDASQKSLVVSFKKEKELIQKLAITKWRAAEYQCVEFEGMLGNKAKDVSRQNLGYDVESITPEGTIRYIEVKSISKPNDSFSMTNNEYSAAHQYGKNYYLCIITQNDDRFIATYISNPINILKLEKRVRQWEWICEQYDGEQYVIDLN